MKRKGKKKIVGTILDKEKYSWFDTKHFIMFLGAVSKLNTLKSTKNKSEWCVVKLLNQWLWLSQDIFKL